MELKPGMTLDRRFRLSEVLGHGAMGSVYRACDLTTGLEVAIKVLQQSKPDDHRRLLREYLLMRRIDHPCLPRPYEWGLNGRYFAMEWIDGSPLNQQAPDALRSVLADLLRGLAAIHAHGYVHLDLRPANLLITQGPRSAGRIIDVGLARRTGRALVAATGTPAYAAPEVLHPGDPVDGRADLFSLAAAVLDSITPQVEGRAESAEFFVAQGHRITNIRAQIADAPKELRPFLKSALHENPNDRPDSAHDALGLLQKRSIRRNWPLLEPRFTGRSRSLNDILGAVAAGLQDTGAAHFIQIVGEPGIGKSRLLDQLEFRLRNLGIDTVRGAWGEATAAPTDALRPLVDALERSAEPDEVRATPRRLPPSPEAESPSKHDLATTATESSRAHSILEALQQRTAPPLVALLEDAQWAGPDARQALLELADSLGITQLPLVIVITQRPGPSLFPEGLNIVGARLDPLTQPNVERLAACMLGTRRIQPGLVDALFDSSAGNPLAVTEIVRNLVLSGDLRRSREMARVDRPPDRILGAEEARAQGLEEVLEERMELLPPEVRHLVAHAATLGPQVRYDVLSSVSGLDDETVLDQLEEVIGLRIMERRPQGGRLQFTHARVRDLIYARLPAHTRRSYHRDAARVMLALGDEALVGDAGSHLFSAGEAKEAFAHLVLGARRAERESNLIRSVELYRTALKCPASTPKHNDIRVSLGEHLRQLGCLDEAEQVLRDGLRAAWPSRGEATPNVRSQWDPSHTMDPSLVVKELKGADTLHIAGFLNTLGNLRLHQGDPGGAEKNYRLAIALHQAGNRPRAAHGARVNLGRTLGRAGQVDTAIQMLQETVAELDEDTPIMMVALHNLGHFLHESGNGRLALEYFERSLSQAQRKRDSGAEAATLGSMGEVFYRLGELTAAQDHLERSLAIHATITGPLGRVQSLETLGQVFLDRGEYQKAQEIQEQCLHAARGIGSLPLVGSALCGLANVLICIGDYERARRELGSALVVQRRIGEPGPIALTLKTLGAIAISAGALREAGTHLREADTVAKAGVPPEVCASIHYHLARVKALRGEPEVARETLEATLKTFRALGAQRLVVRVLLALAELDDEDKLHVTERVQEALSIASQLGGRALIGQARIAQSKCLLQAGERRAAEKAVLSALEDLEGRSTHTALARAQLGAVCAMRGRINRAEREFEAAAHTLGQLGRRFEEARTLLRWAELEAELGDDDKARTLSRRAASSFDRIGASFWARRARQVAPPPLAKEGEPS